MFVDRLKDLGHKVVLARADRKLMLKYSDMMQGANIDDLGVEDEAASTPMNTSGSPNLFRSASSHHRRESDSKPKDRFALKQQIKEIYN